MCNDSNICSVCNETDVPISICPGYDLDECQRLADSGFE
jgi:hypothetical protein